MDVSLKHKVCEGTSDVRLIATCEFRSIPQAQALARLLVGIEIQPDGAAWKRGPRPPALPTDSEGRTKVSSGDLGAPMWFLCEHKGEITQHGSGGFWTCDICGVTVP